MCFTINCKTVNLAFSFLQGNLWVKHDILSGMTEIHGTPTSSHFAISCNILNTETHCTPTSSQFTISCDILTTEIHHTAVILLLTVTFLLQRFILLLLAVILLSAVTFLTQRFMVLPPVILGSVWIIVAILKWPMIKFDDN